MDKPNSGEVVIRGVTSQGKVFRPSDWADRLASITSSFGTDNRLNYCPCVQPVTRAGLRCVVVAKAMEQEDSRVFKFLMAFARDNDLEIVEGRTTPRE
jgi:hypothetical protein